jgi:Integrase zinc binding domain
MILAHDHPTAGYPRQDETIRKAKAITQWQGINQWIANYVKGYAICQQNKIPTYQRKIPLYQITIQPETCPFQQIVIDLITGLL